MPEGMGTGMPIDIPDGIGIGIVVVSCVGSFVALDAFVAGRVLEVSAFMPGIPLMSGTGAGFFGGAAGFWAAVIAGARQASRSVARAR